MPRKSRVCWPATTVKCWINNKSLGTKTRTTWRTLPKAVRPTFTTVSWQDKTFKASVWTCAVALQGLLHNRLQHNHPLFSIPGDSLCIHSFADSSLVELRLPLGSNVLGCFIATSYRLVHGDGSLASTNCCFRVIITVLNLPGAAMMLTHITYSALLR